MHAQCLVAEYGSLADARVGLAVLEKFDFDTDAVSVVSRGDQGKMPHVGARHHHGEETVRDTGRSAGLGTLIGGAAGVPLAIGSLVGPFLIAGPLAGMAAGAAAGGLLSPATEWGLDEEDADTYEKRVEEGSVLIIVTSTPGRLDDAEQGLQTTGPKSLERFIQEPETDA